MKLQALQEALKDGPRVGALIHDKTAVTRHVEVLAVEEGRLLAVARLGGDDADLFRPDARVRLELPKETSVVYVPGRVTQRRQGDGVVELEIDCPEGAEDRQRRMDVRVSAECRIRVGGSEAWEETRTINVSAGGTLIAQGGTTHAGDLVEVELDLDGETILCQAEVVRRGVKADGISSRTNAAVRFIGLSEAQRHRIALYVLSVQASEKAAKHPRLGPRMSYPRESSLPRVSHDPRGRGRSN
jgi:c-di-GMP-binding flagellar brake protein YcgR